MSNKGIQVYLPGAESLPSTKEDVKVFSLVRGVVEIRIELAGN